MTYRNIHAWLGASALVLAAFSAQGQMVYKIVGPDGKITFSDKPPAADKGKIANTGTGGAAADAVSSNLPYELRQVVAKYPVTLYASAQCAPCDSARSLLKGRGVPYTERSVTTPQDVEALTRLVGENFLPFGTIGGQRLKGFSDVEWSQYLDAAGYPKSSLLPNNYSFATATPLVALQKPAALPKEAAKATEPAPVAPSAPIPSNPAGITF